MERSFDLKRFAPHAIRVLALLAAVALGAWLFGGDPSPDAPQEQAAVGEWTCSMHPQIRQPGPGACPLCGMDLIPVSLDGGGATDRVVLSERARALAGVRTTEVKAGSTGGTSLQLLGRVEADESTLRDVTTWVDGRIDRLHINSTGERVRRGQVIATLYSAEVYGAHQDLLAARDQVARLSESPPAVQDGARAALKAAQTRLRLLGLPDDEIERMAAASEPTRSVPIRSPYSGTVIKREATEGMHVKAGTPLYRLADLRSLWVQLDAYESDLSRLQVGQAVTLRVEAWPGESFEGTVSFIDPTVDAARRVARVRVQVANPDGRLRPGMFAEASIADGADAESTLMVPATAPLFTGRRSVVYVEAPWEDGVAYEPRTVRLGARVGEHYPVIAGLQAGERVVTRGAFALDADLQIRGGPSMMTRGDDRSGLDVVLTPEERAALGEVLQGYFGVQASLAADDHAGAVSAAQALGDSLNGFQPPKEAEAAWEEVRTGLFGHGQHVGRSTDIAGAREGFEPLTHTVEELLEVFGNPLDTPVNVAFCPMVNDGDGARWVQLGESIDNAYFGAAMPNCGEITDAVLPNSHLERTQPAPAPAGHSH